MDEMELPYQGFVKNYLPALLTRASYLVAQEFHALVARRGFSANEWRVLATLHGEAPMSIGALADLTVLKLPTLTRVLDRMEQREEVRRIAHPSDRRVTLVTTTEHGDKLAAELIALALEHEQCMLAPFGQKCANELRQALQQMIATHQEVPPRNPS